MILFISVIIALTCIYAGLLLLYRRGWQQMPEFAVDDHFSPVTSISVIIPARNEAANIAACIRSITAGNYPGQLLEIIVVDDCSEDDTAAIVQAFLAVNIHCILLKELLGKDELITSFKKKALSTGIAAAKGELIVTTDADCIAGPGWLMHIAALYERQHAVMIAAPVDFITEHSMVGLFQSIDFMTMQGITVAAHQLHLGSMANGANLAFSKVAFEKVNGYQGIDHLASGDDYLLLVKMRQQFPDKIFFLKSRPAIIRTLPQPDWRSFLQQRIRWASKSGKYPDARLNTILLIVYLFNLSFLAVLVAALFHPALFYLVAGMLLVKLLAESLLVVPVARFFDKREQFIFFLFLQPLHISYVIIAGLLGMVGQYQWKGRSVR